MPIIAQPINTIIGFNFNIEIETNDTIIINMDITFLGLSVIVISPLNYQYINIIYFENS